MVGYTMPEKAAPLDTDGDGFLDVDDACPNDPGPALTHGCPDPDRDGDGVPDRIAAVIQAHPEIGRIRIEGHTDRTGSLDFNMKLSKRRAASVVSYLVGKGVSQDRLVAEGFGPTRPLVPDAKTKAELAKNRRVEFHIVEPEEDSP
jgi:flagellar motor protein MotB